MDFTKIFDFVGDIPDGAKYVAALIFVLILILLVGWVLRKISTKVRKRGRDGGRLKVGESIMLDSQRTLTLVSCDDVEHLILLGDTNDLVIAASINNPGSAVNNHGFSEAGDRIAETPAPVQTAVQTTPAPVQAAVHTAPAPAHAAVQTAPPPPPRAISTQEPTEPVPQARQPAPYREPPRNTAVQALAKPAPRPRPSTLPPGPGRRGPETRPRPVAPAHSDAGQLNGEEGVGTEDATAQSFAEIRPGDEK